MGYYTTYNLTMPRNPITPEQLAAWIKSDDEAKYSLTGRGDSSGNESRWYEHDVSMCALSAKYPNTIFKLHGDGDESGDIWDKYYAGGKVQHSERLKTDLPVPDLDAMVPSPQATAKARSHRIVELIKNTQAADNFDDFDDPGLYLAIEYADGGVALAAFNASTIPDITQQINESDTDGRDYIVVYDLDTDEQFTPVLAVTYYASTTRKIDVNGIDL